MVPQTRDGPQLPPQGLGEGVEVEQVGQILLQAPDHLRVGRLPATLEVAKGFSGLGQAPRQIDFLRLLLDRVVVAPADRLAEVPHLVPPAALMRDRGVETLQDGGQGRAAVVNRCAAWQIRI